MKCFAAVAGLVLLVISPTLATGATITWNFENNDMKDTTGTLDFNVLSSGVGSDISFLFNPVTYAGSDAVLATGGTYLARSDYGTNIGFGARSDDNGGSMESDAFTLEASANLSFYSAGNGGTVSVHRSSDDTQLESLTLADFTTTLSQKNIDLGSHNGETVYIRVNDPGPNSWGFIGLDNIEVTNAIVPEPCSISMIGMAIAVGVCGRRRRKRG